MGFNLHLSFNFDCWFSVKTDLIIILNDINNQIIKNKQSNKNKGIFVTTTHTHHIGIYCISHKVTIDFSSLENEISIITVFYFLYFVWKLLVTHFNSS